MVTELEEAQAGEAAWRQRAENEHAKALAVSADLAIAKRRIVALEQERDDYILKQKVWEEANDELRSEHIRLKRGCEFSDSGKHECKHCDAVGFPASGSGDT